MSKKKSDKQTPVPSTSRELVRVGARHVQVTKHGGKRTDEGKKPSTERALILRNGKYGSQGTGEMVVSGKISGREKLDLIAEDLINQSRSAVMSPLNMEKCIKIADSQLNAYLDDISDLQDPELFKSKIDKEVTARTSRNGQWNEVDASQVAVTVATRIHNSYMVASAWKITLDLLRSIEKSGLSAKNAQGQLKKDETLRTRYLALLDFVNELVGVEQRNFSTLAKNAPHYQRYFNTVQGVKEGEPEVSFDWGSMKDACKSFLDSIIVELCFPRAPYPKRILYAILHDAIDESPWEAKRFPQLLWDAVGELSVTLELQELLESPLLGPEGQKIKEYPHQMAEAHEAWHDAQIYSTRALALAENFQNLAFPLEKTQNAAGLENLWKTINENYKAVCGENLDTVWHLEEALKRTPQWTVVFVPRAIRNAGDESDPEVTPGALVKARKPKRGALTYKKTQKKMLAITDGRAEESDDSMPSLQSVSDSSDESDWDDESESESDGNEEEEDWFDDDDDESGYDSEQQELMKGMEREAMDAAMAIPEFFDPKTEVPEFEALAEERKTNPFLKLLGSLRGRMFSSDSTMTSTTRTEPRTGLFRKKPAAAPAAPKPSQKPAPKPYQLDFDLSKIPEDELPPLPPIPGPRKKRVPQLRPAPSDTGPTLSVPQQPQSQKATVEEVEDEDAASTTKKKKKKKSKKKKSENAGLDTVAEDAPTPVPASKPPAPTQKPAPTKATSPPVTSPAKSPAKKTPPSVSSTSASMASLTLERTPTVQSGHSYLAGKEVAKEKIKSRPGHASLFSTKGFLNRDGKEKIDEEPEGGRKGGFFGNLSKKATGLMHQLLNTSEDTTKGIKPMKWENFVRVMLEMGFEYDPSTAGSSVRFDPPGGKDRSISFHKPHPDTTIGPILLKEWSKKLKRYYGWMEEDILQKKTDD